MELAGQEALGMPCLCVPELGYRQAKPCLASCVGARIQTQVLMLQCECTYNTESVPHSRLVFPHHHFYVSLMSCNI